MKKPNKAQVNVSIDHDLFQRLEDYRFNLVTKYKKDISRSSFFESIFMEFFENLEKMKK